MDMYWYMYYVSLSLMLLSTQMLVTITCPHSMIILLLGAGGRGRGNGAWGPQQIILPDQPKLGCYGPAVVVYTSALDIQRLTSVFYGISLATTAHGYGNKLNLSPETSCMPKNSYSKVQSTYLGSTKAPVVQ